ncbi:MAG: flagellar biosynthesis protein FliQ [Clostridiales bacterium]|jgi:flagellar biosynthetic protein FliQ|nr:flagellar biosynthesis protein FliQ [Clostridiales bacterium]
MSGGDVLKVVQDSIFTVILVSAPPLLLGLVVGLIVSVFQAVTSIQEATLAFVPKILAVFAGIYIFGAWMWSILESFTVGVISNAGNYIAR